MKKLQLNETKILRKGINLVLATGLVFAVTGCAKESTPAETKPVKEAPAQNTPVEEPKASTEPKQWTNEAYDGVIANINKTAKSYKTTSDDRAAAYLREATAVHILAYVNQDQGFGMNPNFKNKDRANIYEYTGYLASMELEQQGKFSDVWYEMMKTEAMEERFKQEIATPIEAAYGSGDFSAILEDLSVYTQEGKYDDHITNLKITILNQAIRANKANTPEDQEKIKSLYYPIFDKYNDGTLLSVAPVRQRTMA